MNQKENSPFDFEQLGSFDQPKDNDTFSVAKDSETVSSGDFEFNFDSTESETLIKVDEPLIDRTELVRVMDCVCPKCAEKTEVDLALMPENGFVVTCSSCNKQIHVIRESCACRARRKSSEINCTNCGKLLDHHAHCQSCGTNFPDFFVTINPEDARRKSRSTFFSHKLAAIRNFNFSLKPSFNSGSQDITPAYSPVRHSSKTVSATPSLISRKYVFFALYIILAVAIAAGGIFAYNSKKAEQMYTENYFKALYCIKTGVDSNINASTTLKNEWETALKAGLKFTPVISSKDETNAAQLRSTVDKYMLKMGKPAKQFSQIHSALLKIHSIYLETESLTQSRPNSLQDLTNSVDSLNKKMLTATQELKANIPESFKKELETTKLKYRQMKDF